MEAESGLAWSATRRAELDIWHGWISTMLRLDSAKEEEIWIPNSVGRFLITEMECLRQWGCNDIEVVAPGRNPGFFQEMSVKDGRSLSAYPGSHAFRYYRAVVKTIWQEHCIWKRRQFHCYQFSSVTVLAARVQVVERVLQTKISPVLLSQ